MSVDINRLQTGSCAFSVIDHQPRGAPRSVPTVARLTSSSRRPTWRGSAATAQLSSAGRAMYAANRERNSAEDALEPQMMAYAIAALIAMPTGQRPLRATVASPPAPQAARVDEVAARVQAQALRHTGPADMPAVDPARP